jgi:hypothetical protein
VHFLFLSKMKSIGDSLFFCAGEKQDSMKVKVLNPKARSQFQVSGLPSVTLCTFLNPCMCLFSHR